MPIVSLQLPEEILNKFDNIQKESKYGSRSEALRDAMLLFIKDYESRKKIGGIKKALMVLQYVADIDTLDIISSTEHRFENEIKTYIQYIIDSRTIRIYLVIGDMNRLNDFVESFNQIKDKKSEFMVI
jgi:metal-responsive CopG/Arc/MetJ family transcriptional regulator